MNPRTFSLSFITVGEPTFPCSCASVCCPESIHWGRATHEELLVVYSGLRQEGQFLYRKLDQATGLPVPDTDAAADWAQDTAIGDNGLDPINGKEVQYPGWT